MPVTHWVKFLYVQCCSFHTGLFHVPAALLWWARRRLWGYFAGSPAVVRQTLSFALMSPSGLIIPTLSICLVIAIQATSVREKPILLQVVGIWTNSFQVLGVLSKELEVSIHTDFQKQQDNCIWSKLILLVKEETLSRLTVGNMSRVHRGHDYCSRLPFMGFLIIRGIMALYFD